MWRRSVGQYIEELPVVRPRVIKLTTEEADCRGCRKAVRSSHPLQVSLAEGAAGVQLGPRAVGLAAQLNKHLKAIKQADEGHPSAWLESVRWLLKVAMALKSQALDPAEKARCRAGLETRARELLASPRPTNLEEKVRRRLEKQQDHLFTFLEVQEVEATNNLAERQLRPAVIARKLSCGNKTSKGAHTWEILASLAATCLQQKQSFAKLISQAAILSPIR